MTTNSKRWSISDENEQVLIHELDLHEWDLTESCADLIKPAELIRGLLDSIEHERKPLIERIKSALSG